MFIYYNKKMLEIKFCHNPLTLSTNTKKNLKTPLTRFKLFLFISFLINPTIELKGIRDNGLKKKHS